MYLSRSYYNRKDYLTAVSEFTRVLDRHQAYTAQALIACENVVQDFGGVEVSLQKVEK